MSWILKIEDLTWPEPRFWLVYTGDRNATEPWCLGSSKARKFFTKKAAEEAAVGIALAGIPSWIATPGKLVVVKV